MSDHKTGAVYRAQHVGDPVIALRFKDGWVLVDEGGDFYRLFDPCSDLTDMHALVVMDPEDAEQVGRVKEAWRDSLAAALRAERDRQHAPEPEPEPEPRYYVRQAFPDAWIILDRDRPGHVVASVHVPDDDGRAEQIARDEAARLNAEDGER